MQPQAPLLTIDPLQEMDHLRGVISQESISFDGITRSLKELVPSLQKNFQAFIHGFGKGEQPAQLKADEKDFLKLIEGKVYLNLAPLLTYVPEGMNVTYLEYLLALKDAVQHCHEVALKSINDYSVYLAQLITNRQFKLSAMPHDAMYAKMEKDRTELLARMAKCFKVGSTKAESTYGEVVARNAEWGDVFQMIHQVDQLANTIRRDDLYKKAEECNDQLNTIIRQIRNSEFEGVAPDVVNNLSNGAYQVGAELEFFAAVYFRVLVINTALADTVNKVGGVLKQLN